MSEAEAVRTHIDRLVEDNRVPGAQYLVVDSGGVVFEHAGGWADLATRRSMDPSTTMMAYSMSKTITAAAVLQLADDGKLSLEDPVVRYVEFAPYASATIGQLLTHTAGVPAPLPLRWVHLSTEHASFDERAALRRRLERNRHPLSDPGAKYRYSNLGYWLLGPVVEAASGQPFTDYVAEHVLAPLGAPASELGYAVPDAYNHAKGYLEKYSFLNLLRTLLVDRRFIGNYRDAWLEIVAHYVDGPAFGGLVGSARGFGRFLQDQLRPHSVLFGDGARSNLYRRARTNDGVEIPVTSGWHIGVLGDTRYFYKEGGGAGFHSMMRLYPEDGVGTVVMTNATTFKVRTLADVVDRRFLAD